MKQEIKDVALQAAVSAPTSIYAIFTKLTIAEWVAVGLGVLQALYLLRKWWREETEAGVRMKRWAQKHGLSKPAPLDRSETDG